MNEIQAPRINEALRRKLAMKVSRPSPMLSSDVVPVIVVDPFDDSDYYLNGWRLARGGASSGQAAAANSRVTLFNPTAGTLVQLRRLIFSTEAASEVQVRAVTTQGASGSITEQPQDGRWGEWATAGRTQAQVSHTNTDALFEGIAIWPGLLVLARTVIDLPFSAYLLAGQGVQVRNNNVNVRIDVGFEWVERPLTIDEQR